MVPESFIEEDLETKDDEEISLNRNIDLVLGSVSSFDSCSIYRVYLSRVRLQHFLRCCSTILR